jgi:pimeloyl-ACP methyl ester carboxylesterase
MPQVQYEGRAVHYETEGSGPAVQLVHGITQCADDWYRNGYVAALADDYRLIIPDLPGHGQSDGPHTESAYSRENMVGALLAVLDDAGVDQVVYWGFSLGAILGYSAASLAPERVSAWVLGGMDPYGVISGEAWYRRWEELFR